MVLLMTIIFVILFLPETKGTTPEELRDDIVRSLSTMLALSDDSTNADHYSSSAGNPIDVEWRQAMDDLRRQEEEDMKRGRYSKYSMICSKYCLVFLLSLTKFEPHVLLRALDYGFEPIDSRQVTNQVGSDWQRVVTGEH